MLRPGGRWIISVPNDGVLFCRSRWFGDFARRASIHTSVPHGSIKRAYADFTYCISALIEEIRDGRSEALVRPRPSFDSLIPPVFFALPGDKCRRHGLSNGRLVSSFARCRAQLLLKKTANETYDLVWVNGGELIQPG